MVSHVPGILHCFLHVTDKKATTPKRRRNVLAGAGSPTPGSTPKTPGGLHRLPMPLSERQQMALLLQLTAEKSQQGGVCVQWFLFPRNVAYVAQLDLFSRIILQCMVLVNI